MPIDSLAKLLQALKGILSPDQEKEAVRISSQWPDPKSLAKELVKRGWLTSYQANKIFQDQAARLKLGPYVLIDLLGEGGMGQVFKARHTVMDRVVALKVIRADRLSDADTITRFQREIKAVAKLSHPNVVHAYDADAVNGTHYFAMEFVEGTDLAKLLKERGPFPVAQACGFIRQAALGLQHAHEHDLVHRDIKPGNLIYAKGSADDSAVKILDLGLARLRSGLAADQNASTLTHDGSILGTPDYLAPEQAADAGTADIRADIYSLGCTLYHLLTGQVPFPGGSLAQKLQWHQNAEPAAIESVRRDLPDGLGAVVRRMMAKNPRDRFQTPGEVAQALLPFCDSPRGSSTVTQAYIPTATTAPAPTPAGGRPWMFAGMVVAGLLALLGGIAVFAVLAFTYLGRDPVPEKKPVDTEAGEVVVHLVGVAKPEDPKNVVFLLNNQPVDFDAFKNEFKLAVGAQELVIQQNGVILERRDFIVLKEHHQQRIVIPEVIRKPGKITDLAAHQGEVSAVDFSGDGLRLLSVGPAVLDGVFIWDVPSGRQLHHYIRGKKSSIVKGIPWSGALSPDGHAALIGSTPAFKKGGTPAKVWVQLLGMESGTKLWERAELPKRVNSTEVSRDGKWALAADDSSLAIVWDAANGKKMYQLRGNRACFSPTGDRVLTADQRQAHLWLLGEPLKELQVFKGHSDLIRSVAFAPDGRHVFTSGDGTIRMWSIATGKETQIFKGHDKEVTSIAVSPDGTRVLSGSKDGTIRLWSVATGNEILRFHAHAPGVNCVAYSPGGRRAASGGRDNAVRVWALPK